LLSPWLLVLSAAVLVLRRGQLLQQRREQQNTSTGYWLPWCWCSVALADLSPLSAVAG
jgi:hypothetical protein